MLLNAFKDKRRPFRLPRVMFLFHYKVLTVVAVLWCCLGGRRRRHAPADLCLPSRAILRAPNRTACGRPRCASVSSPVLFYGHFAQFDTHTQTHTPPRASITGRRELLGGRGRGSNAAQNLSICAFLPTPHPSRSSPLFSIVRLVCVVPLHPGRGSGSMDSWVATSLRPLLAAVVRLFCEHLAKQGAARRLPAAPPPPSAGEEGKENEENEGGGSKKEDKEEEDWEESAAAEHWDGNDKDAEERAAGGGDNGDDDNGDDDNGDDDNGDADDFVVVAPSDAADAAALAAGVVPGPGLQTVLPLLLSFCERLTTNSHSASGNPNATELLARIGKVLSAGGGGGVGGEAVSFFFFFFFFFFISRPVLSVSPHGSRPKRTLS